MRVQPHQTMKTWGKEVFKNLAIRKIWTMFPGMLMWEIWKERNDQIFKGQKTQPQVVWNQIVKYTHETIKITHWHEKY